MNDTKKFKLKSALNAIRNQHGMEAVKELIRSSKVISGDKWDDIDSVGQLLEAVKNAKDQDLTDGRVLKEMFQKIQLLDLLMLILVLTGTFLTFRSVGYLFSISSEI
jgi:hypothetical protein